MPLSEFNPGGKVKPYDSRTISYADRILEAAKRPFGEVLPQHTSVADQIASMGYTLAKLVMEGAAGDDINAELAWRRTVMGDAKEFLAEGNGPRAYVALTRHEQDGYPWAPGVPGNQGPDFARESLRAKAQVAG